DFHVNGDQTYTLPNMDKMNTTKVTVGCSKNEIDSELMMGILKNNNYKFVSSLEDADIIIINTCGFIEDAKKESIETIWKITRYKIGRASCRKSGNMER